MLNHSLDQQALSRIHRIGQTKKTFVHRYLISDSIEEKINRIRVFRQMHESQDQFDRAKDNLISAGGLDGELDIADIQALLSQEE